MAELDRRLRLAAKPAQAGAEGATPNERGVDENAVDQTLEGAGLPQPDAVVPTDDRASAEPEVQAAMDEDGGPGGSAADELPPVEDLAKRLRPEVLAALDELFRAKWTGVKRLRPSDLKTGR
jgi:hypothetical protein